MNGYLLFGRLDTAAGDRLLKLVGPAGPLRAVALGATGRPGAVAAYDADTIADARARIDQVEAAGLTPTEHLAYAGDWTPPPAATPADATAPTDPTTSVDPTTTTDSTTTTAGSGGAAGGGIFKPLRVFGLAVEADGLLSVTLLAVPPLARAAALAAAADADTAVSPVTGGGWDLLVEHVAPTVAALQSGVDGLYASLTQAGVAVTAGTTLYASRALFQTTNPNTPPLG